MLSYTKLSFSHRILDWNSNVIQHTLLSTQEKEGWNIYPVNSTINGCNFDTWIPLKYFVFSSLLHAGFLHVSGTLLYAYTDCIRALCLYETHGPAFSMCTWLHPCNITDQAESSCFWNLVFGQIVCFKMKYSGK